MMLGLGVDYGPTTAQLGAPESSEGAYFPVGSTGDQYNTCVEAGGDPAACAGAVFGTAGGTAPKSPSGCSWYQERKNGVCATSSALIMAGLVFGFLMVSRVR